MNTRTEMTRNEFEFVASQALLADGYFRSEISPDFFIKDSGNRLDYAEFLKADRVMVQWTMFKRLEGTVDVRVQVAA